MASPSPPAGQACWISSKGLSWQTTGLVCNKVQCTASGRNACDTQPGMQPACGSPDLTRGCNNAGQLSHKCPSAEQKSAASTSSGLCPFNAAGASPAEHQPAEAQCWTLAGWYGAAAVKWLWWERGLPPAARHPQFLEKSAAGHVSTPQQGRCTGSHQAAAVRYR